MERLREACGEERKGKKGGEAAVDDQARAGGRAALTLTLTLALTLILTLTLTLTSVDDQARAGDVAGCIRGEEGNHAWAGVRSRAGA